MPKFFTETNIFYILISSLILTSLADIITALSSPIFKIAESNVLIVLLGTETPLLLLSIGVVIWIWHGLKKRVSLPTLYIFSMLAVYLSFGHIIGAMSNIWATSSYNENPEEVAKAYQNMNPNDKISNYFIVMGLFVTLPVVLSFLAFYAAYTIFCNREGERQAIILKIKNLIKNL